VGHKEGTQEAQTSPALHREDRMWEQIEPHHWGHRPKSLLLVKGPWLHPATLLSQAMRAWDHLGVSTLQTPWVVGSPEVVLLDKLWLGRESMTVRMARMRDRTRRMVVEEMVL
jgi:hypothetical protein